MSERFRGSRRVISRSSWGRLEASGRPRPSHFATMPNVKTARHQTIRACLRTQGWLPGREIVVFSDGDPSLADAVRHATNSDAVHILDWFHVSMRGSAPSAMLPIVGEGGRSRSVRVPVCCPRSRSNACEVVVRKSHDSTLAALWAAGELRRVDRKRHSRRVVAKINRLGQMTIEFDRYLEINQPSMPNYAKRSLQGLPVSSSRAESSANALVNRRMDKRRQMRWPPQPRSACSRRE
jgi:hypothetical protein